MECRDSHHFTNNWK